MNKYSVAYERWADDSERDIDIATEIILAKDFEHVIDIISGIVDSDKYYEWYDIIHIIRIDA